MKNIEKNGRPECSSVMEKYGSMLYRICLSVVHDSYYAEDAVSETLLRYYTVSPRFKSDEHERNWLIRVVRNVSIDIARRRSRLTYVSLDKIPEELLAENDDTVKSAEIFSALFSMPEIYSTVVWMYYGEGMDTPSIAKALRISPAAARKRLSRGRELLKIKYEE